MIECLPWISSPTLRQIFVLCCFRETNFLGFFLFVCGVVNNLGCLVFNFLVKQISCHFSPHQATLLSIWYSGDSQERMSRMEARAEQPDRGLSSPFLISLFFSFLLVCNMSSRFWQSEEENRFLWSFQYIYRFIFILHDDRIPYLFRWHSAPDERRIYRQQRSNWKRTHRSSIRTARMKRKSRRRKK